MLKIKHASSRILWLPHRGNIFVENGRNTGQRAVGTLSKPFRWRTYGTLMHLNLPGYKDAVPMGRFYLKFVMTHFRVKSAINAGA